MIDFSKQMRINLGLEEFGYNVDNDSGDTEIISEMDSQFVQAEEALDESETIQKDIESLESIHNKIESALNRKELTNHSFELVNLSLENIANRYSLDKDLLMVSLEEHGSIDKTATVSMEKIVDLMEALGRKVKELIGTAFNTLLETFASIDKFIKIHEARLDKAMRKLSGKSSVSGTIELSSGVKQHLTTSSGSVDGSSYISELKQSFAILNDLSDSYVKGKLLEQVSEIFTNTLGGGKTPNIGNMRKVFLSSDRTYSVKSSDKTHTDRDRELWDVQETKPILGANKFVRIKLKDAVAKDVVGNLGKMKDADKQIHMFYNTDKYTVEQIAAIQGLIVVLYLVSFGVSAVSPMGLLMLTNAGIRTYRINKDLNKGHSVTDVNEIERTKVWKYLIHSVKAELDVDTISAGSTVVSYEKSHKVKVGTVEALDESEIKTIYDLFKSQMKHLHQATRMISTNRWNIREFADLRKSFGDKSEMPAKLKHAIITKLIRQLHGVIRVYVGIIKSTANIIRHGITYMEASCN